MTRADQLKRLTILWWFFNTRWVTVTAILLFLVGIGWLRGGSLPYPPVLLLGLPAFFYISTAFALLWLRPRNRAHVSELQLRIITNAIIPVDLLLLSVVYLATGGIGGWGRLLFFYIPIISVILFERARAVLIWSSSAAAVVLLLMWGDVQGWLPVIGTQVRETLLANPEVFWLDIGGYLAVLIGIVGVSALASRGFHESEEITNQEFSLFTGALENLPDAVVLWSRERGVTFLNRRAIELFRVGPKEVIDKPIEELTTHETSRLRSALLFSVEPGEASHFALPEGDRERSFMVSNVPISLKRGYGSELRLFRETTHEEEVSKLKSKFMSVAAHQLRTPVAGLKWVIQMILSGEAGPLTELQRDFLERAAQTAERMIRLIGDLLDVSRIEEGRFQYNFKVEQDITKLVEEVLSQFREQMKERGIELKFVHPTSPLPPLMVDTNRLSIALENIVSNAFKYTLKGSITTTVERQGDDVAIKVADTGLGIPEDEQIKLFAKFYRGSNVMIKGIDGTGLGLFITKSIVERHGGSVSLESKEGKGTTFTLTLPIDPARVPSGDVPIEEVVV